MLFSGVASAAVITNISESAESVSPLLPGLSVPEVTLKDTQGQPVALKKLLANKHGVGCLSWWLVSLLFKAIKEYQNIEQQIAEMGLQIIAVSPDSPAACAKHH